MTDTLKEQATKNKIELERIEYMILMSLRENVATNTITAMATNELLEELKGADIKRSSLWKHLRPLIDLGYVTEGAKYQRQKTYYITSTGIKFIVKEMGLNTEQDTNEESLGKVD